jgi:hypothetical protein
VVATVRWRQRGSDSEVATARLTYGRNTAVYTVMYCIVSVRSLVFVQCTRIRWWYQWPHFTAVFTAVILLATLPVRCAKSV